MSERYRVPKLKISVEICTIPGCVEKVFLFLGESADAHAGPECALDLLNDDNEFLVVSSQAGEVSFLHRGSVSMVTLMLDGPRAQLTAGIRPLAADLCTEAAIGVVLEDGTVVEGVARYELPHASCRIQDFLNCQDRFLPLYRDDRVSFVNKQRIVRVIPR